MKVSLLVATTLRNSAYFNYLKKNIDYLYKDKIDLKEIEFLSDDDNTDSISIKYNSLVRRSSGDILVLLHDDMVLHSGFVENIIKYSKEKQILFYNRVEPPIYMDIYPGKVIKDFGKDINCFNKDEFEKYSCDDNVVNGGSQMFFSIMKKDWLQLDYNCFDRFCEDDDVILRYKMNDMELNVCNSALVYHFVSKTSRTDGGWQDKERKSNENFYKKWGFSARDSKMINVDFLKNTKEFLIKNLVVI